MLDFCSCRTISESIPQLSLMLIMMSLIMTAASIMGVQLWHGLYRNKCFPIEPGILDGTNVNGTDIVGSVFDIRPPFVEFGQRSALCMPRDQFGSPAGGRTCADYTLSCDSPTQPKDDDVTAQECTRLWRMHQVWGSLECRADKTNLFPNEKMLSFDNFGEAMFLVFQIITLSSWSQVMYTVTDIDDVMTVPFFVIVVMFGAYFIQNLTVAILKAKFDSASDKILEELKLEEKVTLHELEFARDGSSRGKKLIAKLRARVHVLSALGVLQKFMDDKAREGVNRPDLAPISTLRWKQARAKVNTVNILFGGLANTRKMQIESEAHSAISDAEFTLGRSRENHNGLQDLIFGHDFDDSEAKKKKKKEPKTPGSPSMSPKDRAAVRSLLTPPAACSLCLRFAAH